MGQGWQTAVTWLNRRAEAAVHRLRRECLALSKTVAMRTFWHWLSGESLVRRIELRGGNSL
ncbi:hypothetical protein [Streptomyces atroolivaceus]|uniref:Transposase n=1 Tax=Streptomyces atroolivaceus TaxID=66869 RepID=A0ABV9VD76_STRAZ|nr:hypothetical protein [Streptomyces atroolivaceus]